MVRFLTLLVGLVTGPQVIDVSVSVPVARVELRLDGRTVAVRDAPPWSLSCDFGRRPQPAELVVIAFDEAGREVGRDRQWVNIPGRPVEAAIVPEFGPDGRIVAARITWNGHAHGEPRRVRVEIDGDRVRAEVPYRIDLTGYTDDQPHVLVVDVSWGRDLELRRELAFGRGFSGTFASGLTAVPVQLDGIDELPPVEQLAGWLTSGGEPVDLAGVEDGSVDLVIVRHPGADRRLRELDAALRGESRRGGRRARSAVDDLGDDVGVLVMLPEPVLADVPGGRPALLFPVSEEPEPGSEGFLHLAGGEGHGAMMSVTMRLANAVALAGMRAAENDRRRAVLLVLGDARDDESFLAPDAAIRYLADLRVPLVVWDLSTDAADVQPGWPVDLQVADLADLRRAVRRLRHLLETQRILWVGGEHLPQSIELGVDVSGITLAR
jgi:hypothetical protein